MDVKQETLQPLPGFVLLKKKNLGHSFRKVSGVENGSAPQTEASISLSSCSVTQIQL